MFAVLSVTFIILQNSIPKLRKPGFHYHETFKKIFFLSDCLIGRSGLTWGNQIIMTEDYYQIRHFTLRDPQPFEASPKSWARYFHVLTQH